MSLTTNRLIGGFMVMIRCRRSLGRFAKRVFSPGLMYFTEKSKPKRPAGVQNSATKSDLFFDHRLSNFLGKHGVGPDPSRQSTNTSRNVFGGQLSGSIAGALRVTNSTALSSKHHPSLRRLREARRRPLNRVRNDTQPASMRKIDVDTESIRLPSSLPSTASAETEQTRSNWTETRRASRCDVCRQQFFQRALRLQKAATMTLTGSYGSI